jgi:hypothetical protein
MSTGRKKLEKKAEVVVSKKVVVKPEKNPDNTARHIPVLIRFTGTALSIAPAMFVGGYAAARHFNMAVYEDKVPSSKDPKADKTQKRREQWDFFADWIVYGPALNVVCYVGGTFFWAPIAGGVKGWDLEHPLHAFSTVPAELIKHDSEPTDVQSRFNSIQSKSKAASKAESKTESKAASMMDDDDLGEDFFEKDDDSMTESLDKKDDEEHDKNPDKKKSSFSENGSRRAAGSGFFKEKQTSPRIQAETPAEELTTPRQQI